MPLYGHRRTVRPVDRANMHSLPFQAPGHGLAPIVRQMLGRMILVAWAAIVAPALGLPACSTGTQAQPDSLADQRAGGFIMGTPWTVAFVRLDSGGYLVRLPT